MEALRLFCLICNRWVGEDSRELQVGGGDNTAGVQTWYRCKHCGKDHVYHHQHREVRRATRLRSVHSP